MTWVATAVAAVGVASQHQSAKKAASAQKRAGWAAAGSDADIANRQLVMQERQWKEQRALQRPWQVAGTNALKEISKGVYELPDAFTYTKDQFQQDPGYAFRLQEGMKTLDRQAAARGGLISGNALRAAQRYGQDMGSQEYQNAYNRALTEYNSKVQRSETGYNRLASMAGLGQTASGQLGVAGQNLTSQGMNALGNFGASMNQNITNAGNARASGYVGRGNALNNALSTGLNYYQNKQYMDMLNKPSYTNSDYSNTPMYLRSGYGYERPY